MAIQKKETGEKKKKIAGFRPIVIIGFIILVGLLIYAVFRSSSVYSDYDVVSTVTRGGDTSTYYEVTGKGMFRYSKDGAAFTDKNNNIIWNQTYEMSSPDADVSSNYCVVGDIGGNEVYVFDPDGTVGSFKTDVLIQQLGISSKGVVGAILSDSDSAYVNLYSSEGEVLLTIKATLENTGYPMAFDLASDGQEMTVSYLSVAEGKVQSSIIFYDLSDPEGDHVAGQTTLDGLCTKVEYLSDSRIALYGENGFSVYSTGSSPEEIASVAFEDDILSVLTPDQKIGFIFRNQDGNGKYRIEIYDLTGTLYNTFYFDIDYDSVCVNDEEIILNSSSSIQIYTENGKLKFSASPDEEISGVMPSWDSNMYWLVTDQAIEQIRIK